MQGAEVTIQCLDPLLLPERNPRKIFTDRSGSFRYGPAPITEYSVTLDKEDITFIRDPNDKEPNVFNFIAQTSPTLEVKARDIKTGEALSEVMVSLSSGRMILSG